MKKTNKINNFSALMIILGSVVGTGVFFNATAVLNSVKGNGFLSILSWLLSGLMAIAGGLTFAELGVLFPEDSGLVVYLEKSFGKKIGFLAGWMQMILCFPALLAAVSLVFGKQLASMLQLNSSYSTIIALVTLGCVIIFNVTSMSYGVKIQNIFTISKFIPIILIIVFGLLYTNKQPISNEFVLPIQEGELLSYFGSAMLTTLFAYDGWIILGNVVGQLENPKKNLPKVFLLGLSLITLTYILINVVYLFVVPINELLVSDIAGKAVAEKLFSGFGGTLVNFGILISIFGTLNGISMGGLVVPENLFKKNWLPCSQKATGKTKSIFSGVIIFSSSTFMILSGSLNMLMDLAIFSLWSFFVLAFIGVIILRFTKKDVVREYKVPLYPLLPLIAILGGLYLIINTLIANQMVSLYFIILMLTSIPIIIFKKI